MAKNKLQGLTLEIGGDTTELSKALKGPNAEANTLQSKLKAVEDALKLDPTNTEILEQKQRLLGKAINATKEKLTILTTAQEQFKNSGKDIDSDEYIEMQRQINKTTKELERLKNQQNQSASSFSKAAIGLKNASNGLDGVAQRTKGLSTAAIGLAGAMAATVPATEELRSDLSKLDNNAKQAGVGIDETRDAFKAFNVVSDETDSSVEATSNLLQAGFTESNLQKAVEGLAGAYLAFPDTMKIESLADSLQETLATGEATGQFGELLDRLGIGADNFSKELGKCATEAEKQNLALQVLSENGLTDSYNSWKENNKALVESKEVSYEFQEALAELAETITPIVTQVTSVIKDVIRWFNELDPTLQKIIGTAVLFVAGLSPVFSVLSKISLGISNILPMLSKLSPAFTSLSSIATSAFGLIKSGFSALMGVIMANPVIAIITGIIAAITLLYTKCEWFRETVNAILSSIWEFLQTGFENVKNFLFVTIPETINSIISWVAEMPGKIWNQLVKIVNNVIQWGKNIHNTSKEWVMKTINSIVTFFSELPSKIWTWLSKTVSNVVKWGKDMVSKGKSAANNLVKTIVNTLKSLPSKMVSIGKDLVRGIFNGISDMTGWIIDKIGGFANSVVDSICGFFGINSPSKLMADEVGKYISAGIGVGIDDNEDLALKPLKKLAGKMSSVDLSSAVNGTLDANSTIVLENTIVNKLDGKVLTENVVRRVTKTSGIRKQFKGGLA